MKKLGVFLFWNFRFKELGRHFYSKTKSTYGYLHVFSTRLYFQVRDLNVAFCRNITSISSEFGSDLPKMQQVVLEKCFNIVKKIKCQMEKYILKFTLVCKNCLMMQYLEVFCENITSIWHENVRIIGVLGVASAGLHSSIERGIFCYRSDTLDFSRWINESASLPSG